MNNSIGSMDSIEGKRKEEEEVLRKVDLFYKMYGQDYH